jgi:glycerophosphoryl diester phosphodiesterase
MGVTATPTAGPTFSLTSVKQPIVFALRASSGAGGCQPRRRSQVHRIITYSRELLISLPNNFEGTLPAYQYAVRNHADILDADVHWTKDGPDRDTVGTVVILHMRLVDFLKYGNSVGKSFAVEIKVSRITDAQAAPLWNAIKNSRVQLQATSTRLPALNKIKKLDAADSKLKISYALITLGTNGWPSVSTIKSVGTAVHAKHTIPAAVVQRPARQHQGVSVHW